MICEAASIGNPNNVAPGVGKNMFVSLGVPEVRELRQMAGRTRG